MCVGGVEFLQECATSMDSGLLGGSPALQAGMLILLVTQLGKVGPQGYANIVIVSGSSIEGCNLLRMMVGLPAYMREKLKLEPSVAKSTCDGMMECSMRLHIAFRVDFQLCLMVRCILHLPVTSC